MQLVTMAPIKQKEQLIELRAGGLSFQAIATELGIAKQTAINWVKELEVEIQNARAIALDALYEKHWMSKKARIELLSEQLIKVKDELSKRSLEDVGTDKLLDMQIKLLSVMKQEKECLAFVIKNHGIDFANLSITREQYEIDN